MTYAKNVDVSTARVETNMSQNDIGQLVDDRQYHSLNKAVLVCVAEHEENVQSQVHNLKFNSTGAIQIF